MNGRSLLETLTITLGAIVASLALFGAFMFAFARVPPADLYHWMYIGGFGTKFSWQNTLTHAAPLILTALCTALPARLGLIVIGGEGSLVLGGLASAAIGLHLQSVSPLVGQICMALAAMVAGGLAMGFVGALRHWRGVNATIA